MELLRILVIDRTDHAVSTFVKDMGVYLGRRNIGMPQQFLNCAQIIAFLQKLRRKAVSKSMTGYGFENSALL